MKFNYENPNQTAQAKVEVLRSVVHHYRGVIELPWKYKLDNPNHVGLAEVEVLSAIVGLFTGDGLPEYLEPKAPEPEPDENPDDGEPQEPEEAVENLKKDLEGVAEVKETEDPGVVEIVPEEGTKVEVDEETGEVSLEPEDETEKE